MLLNFVIKTYCTAADTRLFVGGETMLLREGTMQGDPLPMPMYALALVPIINCLHGLIKQVWYADDAAAAGLLAELRAWWDMFVTLILNMAILSTPLKLF